MIVLLNVLVPEIVCVPLVDTYVVAAVEDKRYEAADYPPKLLALYAVPELAVG